MSDWKNVGLRIPRVLLPKGEIDLPKWAVLACDQYTSQPEYWEKVVQDLGNAPSTLHQIIPECYLEGEDLDLRVHRACKNMTVLLQREQMEEWPEGGVLVNRSFAGEEPPRHGLMLAVDLEAYDYVADRAPLLRPSEGTVVERIPPRLALRAMAEIEYPHIMVLIDDPQKTVIEPLFAKMELFEPIYDFSLGWGGGAIQSRFVPAGALGGVYNALSALKDQSVATYGSAFLMAVGDGNHSLATAKAHWESVKEGLNEAECEDHPARFALVELVNLYDEGISFEPVTRLLFQVPQGGEERIAQLLEEKKGQYVLPLAALQAALDQYMGEEPGVRIDYIHGEEIAREIARKLPGSLVFAPDVIEKEGLFAYIAADGVLPRKAFSMGEADQKRFYLEGRKIR